MSNQHPLKEINTIEDWRKITGSNRNRFYQEVREGRLKARKYGRRTVVLRADFEAWLNDLPEFIPAADAA